MTDRERWTVYPLLFMTLGIAVKDKVVRLTDAQTVRCEQLIVHDRRGHQQVVIAATPAGGLVRTNGPREGLDVLVGHTDRLTGLMFVDAAGNLHTPSIAVASPSARPKAAAAPKAPVAPKAPAEPPAAPPEGPPTSGEQPQP